VNYQGRVQVCVYDARTIVHGTAAGLTFARAFVSGDAYDDLVPGAEHGAVEHEITRSTWQQRHRRTGP
jgi:hypothetical protein